MPMIDIDAVMTMMLTETQAFFQKQMFRSCMSSNCNVQNGFGFERVYGWQNVPIDDARPIHAIISTCSTYGPGRLEFIFPGH